MAIVKTVLDGQNISLSLTAPDTFVDVINVNIVTGDVTSAWLPSDWISFIKQAVALENSVVPPLDRTSLNYLARLVNLTAMDDSFFAGSSVLTSPNVYSLRSTAVSGVDPAVLLVNLPHSMTGAFGIANITAGAAPPVILAGDVIGPSNANVLVAFGPGAVTKGTADKVAVVTTDTKGRVFTLTETSIQITEGQVTNLTTDLGNKADKVVTISAGAGLTGGGDLSANRTIAMPNVGTAGTYGNATTVPVITTDAQGRVSGVTATPITFPSSLPAVYGSYSLNAASTTVPVSPLNPLAVSYDTVEGQNGVSLVGGSRMTVASSGIYETSFSPQLVHAGGGASTIYMWVRVNGVPLVRSNSTVKMANNGDTLFFFIQVILPLNAGDYVEWMIQSTAAGPTTITTFAGTGGAGPNDRPDAPAVIAGIKKIGS